MQIGFDRISHTFYEGYASMHGARPINSNVTFTQASFITNDEEGLSSVQDFVGPESYNILFREDSFDPVTKIRRGRFYKPDISKANPTPATVVLPPGLESSANLSQGILAGRKSLRMFAGFRINEAFKRPHKWPLVVLGWKSSPTFWKILQIENISTGEELVYLRSRNSIGILPEIDFHNEAITLEDQTEINAKYTSLANDLHTSTTQSIVDHCRDVAEVLLRSKIRKKDPHFKGGELDELIKKFSDIYPGDFRLIAHFAQIIRQFHQRRKTALQDKTEIRSITEEDAELAVHCISSMIRDLRLEKVDL